MLLIRRVVCSASLAYTMVLIAYIAFSWFPVGEESPFKTISILVERLTEPLLAPLRRIVPSASMGTVSVDFSVLILFVVFGMLIPGVFGSASLR